MKELLMRSGLRLQAGQMDGHDAWQKDPGRMLQGWWLVDLLYSVRHKLFRVPFPIV